MIGGRNGREVLFWVCWSIGLLVLFLLCAHQLGGL